MKYFNAVTGRIEDDGKDLPEMNTINIPGGRLAHPDGSKDINIPVYADLLKRERLNSKQLELDMLQNPEKYPDLAQLDFSSIPTSKGIRPVTSEKSNSQIPEQMQPMKLDEAPLKQDISRKPSDEPVPQGVNPVVVEASKKKYGLSDELSDQAIKDAQQSASEQRKMASLAQAASTIGDAIAGTKSDQSFYDKMRRLADQGLNDILTRRKGMSEEAALDKASREAALSDPNSNASSSFRKIIEARFPDVVKAYGDAWGSVTAADQENIFKPLQLKEQIEARKQAAQLAYDLKKSEQTRKSAPSERLKSLSGTDKARYDNALMVLKGIDEMGQALDKDQNTFSMVGDNDYTAAARRATEAYGRMQSGGAINKDEEERFEKTLPGKMDSKEMQRKKLLTQRDEMISRLKTLGFTPEEAGYKPQDFNYGSSKTKDSKPKQITQNGHTYILNEATGEYE